MNNFVASYESMSGYERSRETMRFIFSFALLGPAFKASVQVAKATGGLAYKAVAAVERAPSKYQVRNTTLAQRPKIAPSEMISGPLIDKYLELMTKAPEARYSMRSSTIEQRGNASFTPNHSAIAKSNKHNINAQWFDDVSSYFTPIEKLTIPKKKAVSFMAGKYSSYTLKEDTAFWRSGNAHQGVGDYYSNFKPMSEIQSRIDSAILPIWETGHGSVLEAAYCVKIPKGTVIHIGEAAPQGGMMLGGTQQIYIQKSYKIPGVEVINVQTLEEGMAWNQKARKAKI